MRIVLVIAALAFLPLASACDSGASPPDRKDESTSRPTTDQVTPKASEQAAPEPPANPGGDTSDVGAAGAPADDAADADADAGAAEGGGTENVLTSVDPVVDCIDRPVRWSFGGFFGHGMRTWTLEPCRAFSYVYSEGWSRPSPTASCAQDLAPDAKADVDEIDRLMLDPEVLAALTGSTGFDFDPGVADAPSSTIEIEGHSIHIGTGCGTTPGCVPAPTQVARLHAALQQLAGEQLHTGDCSGLP